MPARTAARLPRASRPRKRQLRHPYRQMVENVPVLESCEALVCSFTRGFLLRQLWERGIEIIWALAIVAATFVCFFNGVGAGAGNGLLGAGAAAGHLLGLSCCSSGDGDGWKWAGSKIYKGLERQKEQAILTGSPWGGVFSNRQDALYWFPPSLSLSLSAHKGSVVTDKRRGERNWGAAAWISFASPPGPRNTSDTRTHTFGCFPNLVDF